MAYKMKASIPSLCSSPLQNNGNPKRGRIHLEEINGINNKNTVNQSSDGKNLTTDDVYSSHKQGGIINDPKGVLNREIRKREYKKGYRYKNEKDGSITLRGRKGN